MDGIKGLLRNGRAVTDAIYEAGYGSSSRLYERMPGGKGITPGDYRNGGADHTITYAVADSPLGRMLIGATERGVCTVSFGDDDAALERSLATEFPLATRQRDDDAMTGFVGVILDHIAGRLPHPDLPLNIQATSMEQLVWDHLRTVPYGETRTYGEIAREIGKPGAARAVGRACRANNIALLIPCHRAVRQDGGLGGYRWGLHRKQWLLDRELVTKKTEADA